MKSLHWYKADGTPQHTITGKNGKERSPTVKEAMALNLYPSVTSKLSIISNWNLQQWQQREVARYAYFNQPRKLETDEAYIGRVMEGAFEQVGEAADLGTDIHEALELHFTGQIYDPQHEVYVNAVQEWVKKEGVTFTDHELRLVDPQEGYAGTTDAAFNCPKGYGILDFKSRKTKKGQKVTAHDSHPLQIAAYHHAKYNEILDDAIGCNLYISTTEPGRVEAVWYNSEELKDAWFAFRMASRVWEHMKGYTKK